MTESLYIENFGPIKKAELDLRQAMVFIGPQASGKSAIAKLISILRDWRFVNKEETFETLLDNFNIASFISGKTVIRYESRSHGFKFEKKSGELIFDLKHKYFQLKQELEMFEAENPRPPTDEHLKSIQLRTEELNKLIDKFINDAMQTDEFQKLQKLIDELRNEYNIYQQRIDKQNELAEAQFQFTNYSQYIPAERLLIAIYSNAPFSFINSNLPIPKNILEFAAAFEKAKQEINKFKVPFLDFRYVNENGVDVVYYNQNEKTKLNESSSGLQTLIPLLLVISHKWTDEKMLFSYVVEEPEQNLYPIAQQKLVYHLAGKCLQRKEKTEQRSDLVITTHSPYVLTSFNNLLFADKVIREKGKEEAVSKIIPTDSSINADHFNAYFVAEGGVYPIFNRETGMIAENQLDSASEEIMADFDSLMDIYKGAK